MTKGQSPAEARSSSTAMEVYLTPHKISLLCLLEKACRSHFHNRTFQQILSFLIKNIIEIENYKEPDLNHLLADLNTFHHECEDQNIKNFLLERVSVV